MENIYQTDVLSQIDVGEGNTQIERETIAYQAKRDLFDLLE